MSVAKAPAIPASLARWPGYLLYFVAERTTERFEQALASEGVKARHATVLALIDAEGAMSQRQIGRRLRIDKSMMVGVLDDLERLGYASRERSPADRRTHLVHLTAEGRRVLARVLDVGERENARAFGVLDADEREQLQVLLERVAEANA